MRGICRKTLKHVAYNKWRLRDICRITLNPCRRQPMAYVGQECHTLNCNSRIPRKFEMASLIRALSVLVLRSKHKCRLNYIAKGTVS